MKIGGLQKLTLIDYPGRVACTVFLIGCNFRCGYCHNPELVLPKRIKTKLIIPEKDFFNFLKERKGLLAGVVLSGGEPTIHKELPDFIKKIKKFGYLIKLDTNGSNPVMLQNLIDEKLLDYVAMDIKAPLKNQKEPYGESPSATAKIKNQNGKLKFKKNKYEQVTGVKINLENIKKSIEIIKNSSIDYEFRTTVVPSIHTKEDIIQIAKEISPAKRYFLQKFQPKETIDLRFQKIKPFSDKYMLEIQKTIAPFFQICQIR